MSSELGASYSLVSMVHNDGTECGGGKCAHHVAGKKRKKKNKSKEETSITLEKSLRWELPRIAP